MAMLDLPRDLLEDILSRIPYKSLRDLRFTCKLWNALFKDRGFIQKRFHKAAKEVIFLPMMSSRVYTVNLDLDAGNNYAGVNIRTLDGISNLNLNTIFIYGIFHCDGLLLLRIVDNNKIVVWNPESGKTRWIEPVKCYTRGIFALGYHNELCDSYKVLRILDYPKRGISELSMYEFNTNSWRALDGITLDCIIRSRGVSLKGNTYWIASQVKDYLVLSFDFTTETFGHLNLPFQRLGYEILAISVVKEDQLSILQQSLDTSKVEIWVTTNDKIGQTKVLSWIKLLAVNLNTYYDHKFTCDVSFVIDEEKKVAVCWDLGVVYIFGEDHHYGSLDLFHGCPLLFLQWLVPIQLRGKRQKLDAKLG